MQLPTSFSDRTKPLLGNEWDSFVEALKKESPTSIRLNLAKCRVGELPYEKVPWCNTGYYLESRPAFTFDPLFHAGAYYVQEASSMFLEQVIKQYVQTDVRVLDLCAAPGGKSSHLISLLSEDSLLVSNEVIRSRADILSENMTKTGFANTIVTNNDPAEIGKLTHFFDVILIDAPCSGEGMFRKDKDAISEWSPSNVQLCKERQQRIVADVWDALKPGGLLIYSTCTYNREENEDNVTWMQDTLGAKVLPLAVDGAWSIAPSYDSDVEAYHFFPHRVRGEGFFLSVIQKNEDEVVQDSRKAKKARAHQNPTVLGREYRSYLIGSDDFTFFAKGDRWFAFPEKGFADFELVAASLRLVSAGICLGEFKGKDFVPHHSLAMSGHLNRDAFGSLDVDWHTAISYLRKEALVLPDATRGYILLTYQNIPIGFVKNIGNRANNLYPQEWRIRSGFVPEYVKSSVAE